MHVVSPPCTIAMSHAARVEVEVGHESAHGRPASTRERCRVDARAGHDEEPQLRAACAARAGRIHHPVKQRVADARAADGDDAEQVVRAEPQARPNRGALRPRTAARTR